MTAAEWLSLLEQRAPGLRAAGVVEISLEGVTVKLAPSPPVIPPLPAATAATTTTPASGDPLDAIPGYTLED